jgi:hypothetical protein
LRLVIAYKFLDSADFRTGKSATSLQPDRVKPEFCDLIFTLNMTMWWLIPITCVKEESIGTDSQYCWHLF